MVRKRRYRDGKSDKNSYDLPPSKMKSISGSRWPILNRKWVLKNSLNYKNRDHPLSILHRPLLTGPEIKSIICHFRALWIR